MKWSGGHAFVARTIKLCPQGTAFFQRLGPVVRIPDWLGAQKHSGPLCVRLVPVIESPSRTEIADLLASRVRMRVEFRCDSRQPALRAHGCSSNDHHPAASYEADDPIARGRKPKLDPGIENLVGGRVPAKPQNKLARPAT